MWIKAADIKKDDVVSLNGEDHQVIEVAKYHKGRRKWVTLTVDDWVGDPAKPKKSSKDVAVPSDVMVPWHGTALF